MIPYHIYGHSKGDNYSEPIVWLDSSDSDSYVLGSPELIKNGDFSSGGNYWNLQSEWTINGGQAIYDATGVGFIRQLNLFDFVVGKKYIVKFDITQGTARIGFYGNAGNLVLFKPNNNQINNFVVGSYSLELDCLGVSDDFYIYGYNSGSGTDFSIDNISIKEVLSGTQEVTSIDNKGTLGGQFDLLGSVKFANNGFESWSLSDYISRDLGEPFLPDNSFTMATSFNLQDITSGNVTNRNFFSLIRPFNGFTNLIAHAKLNSNMVNGVSYVNGGFNYSQTYSLGVQTIVTSFDKNSNTIVLLNYNSQNEILSGVYFNNTENLLIQLLSVVGYSDSNSGKNNPLHEFRLYDRAFTLTEMQDLQTELNNKYI